MLALPEVAEVYVAFDLGGGKKCVSGVELCYTNDSLNLSHLSVRSAILA